ncbi:MAG TPA: GNAT family N-acetyltransferase [Flavisolibacter sp.]|nr:GNAT family N-acetyltransferase [Flavisolibacter sp.]
MIKTIDQNFNRHSWYIPSLIKGMQVVHTASLSYTDSGLPCDTFNIIHITNGLSLTREELTTAVDHYRKQDSRYCIWINSENRTLQADAILLQLGLSEANKEPGMALDLKAYTPVAHALFEHIVLASNEQQVADFATVVAANWTPPDPQVLTYYQKTAPAFLNPDNKVILLVYYHEGQPVSVIELFPTDVTTIGLYSLATLETFRGKGIGSAMMHFALGQAKALGYTRAILQASEDGLGIYQRLGFERVTAYFEFQ